MQGLPKNEPVLQYGPNSPERRELRAEVERQSRERVSVDLRIGGEARPGSARVTLKAPHRHSLELGDAAVAEPDDVRSAISAALEARSSWAATPLAERAAIFRRAGDLLAGPFRQRLNAATLLGQSKTPHQAEIDAACELTDFLRFNAHFAERLAEEPLISPEGVINSLDLRPLA